MILHPEYAYFLGNLPSPDPTWGGTGAVPLRFDARDYSILQHPGVARALHAGATGPVDLSSFIGGTLNQGQEGACVAYSTAGLCALDEAIAGRAWPWLDAENLYRRNGGTGDNGIDSRQCLQDVVTKGVNRLNAPGAPVKEASYLFVPKQAGLFKDTIMAALNARKPCVVATLLPQQFGWTSSGSPTSGYHQLLICGGDDTWCEVQNSWGPSWGNNGRGRLLWSYLDPSRWDVFAYTVDPLVSPTPNPNPQPDPQPQPQPQPQPAPQPMGAVVTGHAAGSGVEKLRPGITLQATGGGYAGLVELTTVTPDTLPTPTPSPLPQPNPQPQPNPSGLRIAPLLTRHYLGYLGGTRVGIWAQLTGPSGLTSGTIQGTIGGVALPAQSTSPEKAAAWEAAVAAGATGQLTATAQDGETVTAGLIIR